MDKCININNNKVKEIAAKLGVIPAIAAIKMEIWMNNNGGKIPTAEDLVVTIVSEKPAFNKKTLTREQHY